MPENRDFEQAPRDARQFPKGVASLERERVGRTKVE